MLGCEQIHNSSYDLVYERLFSKEMAAYINY